MDSKIYKKCDKGISTHLVMKDFALELIRNVLIWHRLKFLESIFIVADNIKRYSSQAEYHLDGMVLCNG